MMTAHFLCLMLLLGNPIDAESVVVDLVIPDLEVRPYHRPYVAVWLETTDRQGVHTLAVWHEKEDWLKDMRQWWRKLGRQSSPPYDGVSGATRKPGSYTVRWQATARDGSPLPAGVYFLNIEAAREEGGRDFLRQKVTLGAHQSQSFSLDGELELGKITIKIN